MSVRRLIIDWKGGHWLLWENNSIVATPKHVQLNAPARLVNNHSGNRGWCEVTGVLRVEGDTAIVEPAEVE